jgi:hypothetical protein
VRPKQAAADLKTACQKLSKQGADLKKLARSYPSMTDVQGVPYARLLEQCSFGNFRLLACKGPI